MADFDDFNDNPFEGSSNNNISNNNNNDFDDFLSEPVVNKQANKLPSMNLPNYSAPPVSDVQENIFVETALSKWQAEHRKELQKKMGSSSQAKRDLADVARNQLENHYAERKAKIEKTKTINREDEKAFKEETAAIMSSGTDWEKVGRNCDLVPKNKDSKLDGADVSRMRGLLIDLKNEKTSNKSGKSADLF